MTHQENILINTYGSGSFTYVDSSQLQMKEVRSKYFTEVNIMYNLRKKIVDRIQTIQYTNGLDDLEEEIVNYFAKLLDGNVITNYSVMTSTVIARPEKWYPSKITRLWKKMKSLGMKTFEGNLYISFFLMNQSFDKPIETKTTMNIDFPMF